MKTLEPEIQTDLEEEECSGGCPITASVEWIKKLLLSFGASKT
jgi:hypothetical protein